MTETELADSAPAAVAEPLWRRIIAFPLVALVIAMAVMLAVLSLSGYVNSLMLGGEYLAAERDWLDPLVHTLIGVTLVVVAYKLLVARLGEEPRDDLRRQGSGDFWRGAGLAFVLMSAIVGIAALLGGYRISGWGGSTSWAFFLFAAGLSAGFIEEILVRGIIFRFLEEFGGSWFALAVSAALFGFGHYGNPNATILSSLAIALEAGVLLGGAYMLTRNLWLAIGLHFGWNVTQGYVWDVSVSGFEGDGLLDAHPAGDALISGGAFGLEASVVAMVLATGLGLVMVAMAARRGRVVQPWWVRRKRGLKLPA